MERLGIVSEADTTRPDGPSRRAMLITDPDELQHALLRAETELATYRANLPTDPVGPQTTTSASAEASTSPSPDGPAAGPPASAGPPEAEAAPAPAPPSAAPQPESGPAAAQATPEQTKSAPEQSETAGRPRPSSKARVAGLLKDSDERVKVLQAERPQATPEQGEGPAATPIRPQDQAAQQAQQPLARAAGAGRG